MKYEFSDNFDTVVLTRRNGLQATLRRYDYNEWKYECGNWNYEAGRWLRWRLNRLRAKRKVTRLKGLAWKALPVATVVGP